MWILCRVSDMNLTIELPFTEYDLALAQEEADRGNAGPLRVLCQKEVAVFEGHIRMHPDYSDGLVRIERLAVEGYLYQKIRKHIHAKDAPRHLPPEGPYG
jgi:hypothetical protein